MADIVLGMRGCYTRYDGDGVVNESSLGPLSEVLLLTRCEPAGDHDAYVNYYYKIISAEKHITYAQGTTSYGIVTSSSPTYYKQNERNSDGYWYISISPQ